LYKRFCPGPISFVLKLKRNNCISNNVTNNKRTIAVRFPSHILTRRLLKILKYPLAAPSANLSKKISPVSKNDVIDEFGKKIKFVLDGGQSRIGVESTIVSLVDKPKILRLGGIERNKIEKFLINKNKKKYKKKRIVVPGQGKVHYSPGIPIRLNIKHPKKQEAYMLIKKRKFYKKNFYYLSKKNNLKEAAKNLYKTLRAIKKNKFKSIAVEKIPNIGFGETINDRLIRASK
jgi:L-threonylcarbamoyladenylate synthase